MLFKIKGNTHSIGLIFLTCINIFYGETESLVFRLDTHDRHTMQRTFSIESTMLILRMFHNSMKTSKLFLSLSHSLTTLISSCAIR